MDVPEHVKHLFEHLVKSGYIEQIQKVHREYMGIFSRAILAKIRKQVLGMAEQFPLYAERRAKAQAEARV